MPFDYYLKLEGIEAEGWEDKRQKWIPVLGFSYGIQQVRRGLASDDSQLYGSIHFSGLTVTKIVDETTPQLHSACITHTSIKGGQLDCIKNTRFGTHVYMSYVFTKINITAITQNARPAEEGKLSPPLTEDVSLVFDKVEWAATPYGTEGRPGATRKFMWSFDATKRS